MKLEKVLDRLNSFEKNSFIKILEGIISGSPKNSQKINELLSNSSKDLKNIDNINISNVFSFVNEEYSEIIKEEFAKTSSQLDILIDIISRDGNSIIKLDWFSRLYESEIQKLREKITEFQEAIDLENSPLNEKRRRDYRIYRACLKTAYINDDWNNQERKITSDELSILITLSRELALSQEETKLLNYFVVPLQKQEIASVINDLKSIGVIFFSKKENTVYVADEMVRLLRKVRGKEVADKFFRRVLRLFREPQINLICKEHGIDWKQDNELKIKEIIKAGISFSDVLKDDVHRAGTTLTEKKKLLNDLCDKGLKISPSVKGRSLDEKISNLIEYFEEIEKDEKVGISIDGYEKLLRDLGKQFEGFDDRLRNEFELQENNVLDSGYLLDYNIKPRDVLEIISDSDLKVFCKANEINTRGNEIFNILDAYKDSENLYLENYVNIGCRNFNELKANGLNIKEAEIGQKFEDLTKKILANLGFKVDEELKNSINTSKDRIDILINVGRNDYILVECKTIKEKGYNKFSQVSRQLKSYINLARKNDIKIVKSLLIAPEFSDDFIKDCGLEYELNLSLITASTLLNIQEGFKDSNLSKFPHNLFMRDVLIQEERILKAIGR